MIQNLFTNWKTTSAGLAMIIGSVVHLVFMVKSGTSDETTWSRSLIEIVGGVGLIAAGDGAKSVTKDEAETKFMQKPPEPPKV